MIKKTKTSDYECQHITCLINGPVGSGKTHAIGTLPEDETVILSAESGLLTLVEKNFEVWEINSMEDLRQAFKELANGTKFKHVAIDSLTEISEKLFAALRPHYTKAKNFSLYEEYFAQMIGMIKKFRDLYQYNIWVTCLTKEGDNGLTLDVAQKSLGTRLPQYFDLSCYMLRFEKDEKLHRAMVFDSDQYSFCKSRSHRLDAYEKPDLTNIFNKVFHKEDAKKEN